MLKYYTSPEFIGHSSNFPVTAWHRTNGMRTKTSAVQLSLNCEMITDLSNANDTSDLLVEVLALKARTDELDALNEECRESGDWEYKLIKCREILHQRIDDVLNYKGRKFLLCSEMELLRMVPNVRDKLLGGIEGVMASCRYQSRLLRMIGIKSTIVREPINEYLFYPNHKKNQVVSVGSVKHVKGTQKIIDVFKALEGKGIRRVFVGSPVTWGYLESGKMFKTDMDLYNQLQEVCDEFYDAAPVTVIARILGESKLYLNFAPHETCSRTGMEAMLCGVGILAGDHPLWKEYPCIKTGIDSVESCVELIMGADEIDSEFIRNWALDNISFKAFSRNIKNVLNTEIIR